LAVLDGLPCEGIGPEDTFDGDYGRLLDRVYAKGDTSPVGVATRYPDNFEGIWVSDRAA